MTQTSGTTHLVSIPPYHLRCLKPDFEAIFLYRLQRQKTTIPPVWLLSCSETYCFGSYSDIYIPIPPIQLPSHFSTCHFFSKFYSTLLVICSYSILFAHTPPYVPNDSCSDTGLQGSPGSLSQISILRLIATIYNVYSTNVVLNIIGFDLSFFKMTFL